MPRFTPAEFISYETRRAAIKAAQIPPLCKVDRQSEQREAEIQDAIERHLKSLGHCCWYDRKRMDKPTTSRPGVPDFIGWLNGRPFALEVKARGKKPSLEQQGELRWAHLAGARAAVVYSLKEAIQVLNTLGLIEVDATPGNDALGEP